MDNESEIIEISCPCGHRFEQARSRDGREYPCPACGRIHILLEKNPRTPTQGDKGATTVQTEPAVPRIGINDQVGPYRVTAFVGEGGMGRVYEAVDTYLERKVALKILSQQLMDKKDFVVRFEREARSIARLNHPNIVQIYYTGEHKGLPYYAMEMVSGTSLAELNKGGNLPPDQAVDLLLQAARGLSAAGTEGVIHRDIKPSNLMLDRSGQLKITDFGLAKTVSIDPAITHTGTIIGTPYYMSPEQGEGRTLDERTDIYSLGATFYHLLTGSPPYEADSPIGVILKHIKEEIPPLRSRNEEVPEALAQIIEKMMSKELGSRYENYNALIEALLKVRSDTGSFRAMKGKGKSKTARKQVSVDAAKNGKKSSFVVLDEESQEEMREIPLQRCGIIRRFLALAVDYGIIFLLYWLYTVSYSADYSADNRQIMHDPLWGSLFLLISFLYYYLGDARGGMTLGKVLFRCRVGKGDGQNIGFKRSLVRTVLFFSVLMAFGAIQFGQFNTILSIYYDTGIGKIYDKSNMLLQICFAWLFINLLFLLITQGRATIPDFASGSRLFSVARSAQVLDRSLPLGGEAGSAPQAVTNQSRERQQPESARATSTPSGLRPPPIPRDARFRTPAQSGPGMSMQRRPPSRKRPVLAMLLSFFPGLGQLYNGDIMKAILILLTFWLILPWVLGIFDAYFKARMINRQAESFS